jgi:hypothetical protein
MLASATIVDQPRVLLARYIHDESEDPSLRVVSHARDG